MSLVLNCQLPVGLVLPTSPAALLHLSITSHPCRQLFQHYSWVLYSRSLSLPLLYPLLVSFSSPHSNSPHLLSSSTHPSSLFSPLSISNLLSPPSVTHPLSLKTCHMCFTTSLSLSLLTPHPAYLSLPSPHSSHWTLLTPHPNPQHSHNPSNLTGCTLGSTQ